MVFIEYPTVVYKEVGQLHKLPGFYRHGNKAFFMCCLSSAVNHRSWINSLELMK